MSFGRVSKSFVWDHKNSLHLDVVDRYLQRMRDKTIPEEAPPSLESFIPHSWWRHWSNGKVFRVTGHLCGEFIDPRWIPHTKASDADDFFDLRPNKLLSKQSWGWWFETPSRPLWRHRNVVPCIDLPQTRCCEFFRLVHRWKACFYIRDGDNQRVTVVPPSSIK